jgi:LysM repeat protein
LIGPNGPYNNISFTQFVRWNSAALHAPIFPGDYICIGPLGGAYVAPLVSGVAGGKPVYTTTASPAHETPPGTAENCGRYYDTVKDDYCQMIAMNFTLTFDDLRAMNPQINEECTNLWANASYCVATVQGSTAIPVPVTSATTFKPTSLPGTVAPSAPTQSGASAACYKWYTTVDGDYCYLVYTKFGISFDQLRQWNTVLDEACSNMWPGYAYCVEA